MTGLRGRYTAQQTGAHIDISAIVEMVYQTASTFSAMSVRLRDLQAQTQDPRALVVELDSLNRELTAQVEDAYSERDGVQVNLEAKRLRVHQLEDKVSSHIGKAAKLERELTSLRSNLSLIVERVAAVFDLPGCCRSPPPPGEDRYLQHA